MTTAESDDETSDTPRHRVAQVLSPASLAVGAVLGFLIALVRPRPWR